MENFFMHILQIDNSSLALTCQLIRDKLILTKNKIPNFRNLLHITSKEQIKLSST